MVTLTSPILGLEFVETMAVEQGFVTLPFPLSSNRNSPLYTLKEFPSFLMQIQISLLLSTELIFLCALVHKANY